MVIESSARKSAAEDNGKWSESEMTADDRLVQTKVSAMRSEPWRVLAAYAAADMRKHLVEPVRSVSSFPLATTRLPRAGESCCLAKTCVF